MGKLVVWLKVLLCTLFSVSGDIFSNLVSNCTSLTTISGPSNLIEGYGMAYFLLSNGSGFIIKETVFSPHSERTLLSFKDIHKNNYHAETTEENGMEYLCITSYLYG